MLTYRLYLINDKNWVSLQYHRIICDSWLCLDFPQPESGQSLLYKASNLRRTWNQLLENKLQALDKSVESELASEKRQIDNEQLENELWSNLAAYMNSEILYTLKRLLPADLKVNTKLSPGVLREGKCLNFS